MHPIMQDGLRLCEEDQHASTFVVAEIHKLAKLVIGHPFGPISYPSSLSRGSRLLTGSSCEGEKEHLPFYFHGACCAFREVDHLQKGAVKDESSSERASSSLA
jgi:hypothetical protein